jgi:hypothetical protein
VRDAVGAELSRDAREVAGDQRPADGRDQRVALLVQGVGLERGDDEVVCELVLRVDDDRLHGAAREGALPDVLHVLAALPDVDGEGDDLLAGRILKPADADRCVEPARIGEDHAFCHVCCSL